MESDSSSNKPPARKWDSEASLSSGVSFLDHRGTGSIQTMQSGSIYSEQLMETAQWKKNPAFVKIFILLLNCIVSLLFYGYNASLNVYFPTIGYSVEKSGFLTNLFISANYFFSLIAGILADGTFGKVTTLNIGLWLFLFGQLLCLLFSILSDLFTENIASIGVVASLVIVAAGNGALIPCISSFLGDQFIPGQEQERSTYYSWYYLATQIGSIVSTFFAPVMISYSPLLFFSTGVILLILITLPFVLLQHKHISEAVTPERGTFRQSILVVLEGLKLWKREKSDTHWLDKAMRVYPVDDVRDVKIAISVVQVFLPLPFFWAIYFQIFSVWVDMADAMYNPFPKIPAASITSLNPLMDLFLIPFFAKVVYPLFAACGLPIKPLQRMSAGLVFTILALLVAAVVQQLWPNGNIFLMTPQFFLISCAEITLNVTAIEFAYAQAPERMKSSITAIYFFTVSIGNIFVAVIVLWNTTNEVLELLVFAGVVLVITLLFIVIAIRYKYKEVNSEAPLIRQVVRYS